MISFKSWILYNSFWRYLVEATLQVVLEVPKGHLPQLGNSLPGESPGQKRSGKAMKTELNISLNFCRHRRKEKFSRYSSPARFLWRSTDPWILIFGASYTWSGASSFHCKAKCGNFLCYKGKQNLESLKVCPSVRMDGRTDERTVKWQTKMFDLIGYQILLQMVLRSTRGPSAGRKSATRCLLISLKLKLSLSNVLTSEKKKKKKRKKKQQQNYERNAKFLSS